MIAFLKKIIPFNRMYYVILAFFGILTVFCLIAFALTGKKLFLVIPVFILSVPLVIAFPQALLFLFLASFYWGYHIWGQNYFFISWTHVLFLLTMAGFLSKYIFTQSSPRVSPHRPLLVLMVLFFGVSALSFLLNMPRHPQEDLFVSLSYLVNYAFLIIAFFFFSSKEMIQWKNSIVTCIIVLSLVEIPVVVMQVFSLGGLSSESFRNIIGTFGGHHSQLANMMMFPFGIALFKMLDKSSLAKRLFWAFLTIASLYTIIYSGSRSNLVGIAGAAVVMILLKLKLRLEHYAYALGFFIAVFLLIRFSPLQHLIQATINSSDTGSIDLSTLWRFLIWKDCWDYFLDAGIAGKLFGVGMANLMTIPFPEIIIDSKFVGGAHNIFLHVLLETGIFGFVLYMSFFIVALVTLFRQGKFDRLALAYFFITLSLLLSGISQEIFWFQPVFGCLWLYHTCLLALILGTGKSGGNKTTCRDMPA